MGLVFDETCMFFLFIDLISGGFALVDDYPQVKSLPIVIVRVL